MADLKEARIVAAGRAAETLSPHGLPGAAVDEVVFSKAIAEFAAAKLGVDGDELWAAGVWRPALATCRLNAPLIDRIARRLLRRCVVDGDRHSNRSCAARSGQREFFHETAARPAPRLR
jgi:hypothetical protein